ncbi:HAD-IIIA family hydrolase [Leucobacter sp. USCH14]|uniref:D-glycero-alpha-D-manno-heptose-1,7-bisphosphate 7-phosphatase n=1 Tax=Leucobacter sp. USCH14 TaxID=3024838 RepID=UPI0030AB3AD5
MNEPAVPVHAVLFDRDDTLIVDVPYNGDPEAVEPMPTARAAVDRVRAAGIPVGVISNQSGIGRGLLTREQVQRVNDRVEQLLGPFDVWRFCPHAPRDGCECRKPRPGMILSAAAALSVAPENVVMIGDIGADVDAAEAAGARGILVPTRLTLQQERDDATTVAETIDAAVDIALGYRSEEAR